MARPAAAAAASGDEPVVKLTATEFRPTGITVGAATGRGRTDPLQVVRSSLGFAAIHKARGPARKGAQE